MRSRGPSRRSAVQQPVTDQALPQHYESSKKYDDDPSAVTGRQEKRMGFWKRLIKQWYKSEQQPICGDLSNADAGLTPKQSSSLSLAVPAVVGLVMAGTILYLLLLALQDGSSRPERRFPVKVYLEGATPLPIGSISSRPLDLPILIESVVASPSQFKYPQPLDAQASEEARLKDYANLEIFLMAESNVARVIYRDEWDEIGEVRDMSIRDDDIDAYYSFDDDELRSPYKRYDDEAMKNGDNRCRRVAWHRYQFPNCNTFHELNSAVNVPRYISYGAYRDVFAHVHKKPGKSDVVVWKQSSYKPDVDFTYDMYEFTRMDAIVSERLTSRKRIVDIYGHCGLSVLAEFMASGDLEDATIPGEGYIKQKDLHDEDDVKPQNHFCAEDKLLIALEMAESLALLHDFPDGVIVHDDVQLSQFLYDPNGTIKLNDFNRAEIMLWDDEREQYCRYRNNPGNGNYRAPEEYFDWPLNEKIDVYSFGNNMYALLTGLYPFYEFDGDDEEEVQKKIKNGEKPFVDPRYKTRSYAEGKFVEVMEACWAFNPDDRPDLQSVITQLKAAADYLDKHAELRSSAYEERGTV